jgi:hypothetical protein
MRTDLAEGLLREMGTRVPSKLIDFGRALETYFVSGDFEWHYFLSKPYKWADDYAAWANVDYPQEGDEGWPEFEDAMEALTGA